MKRLSIKNKELKTLELDSKYAQEYTTKKSISVRFIFVPDTNFKREFVMVVCIKSTIGGIALETILLVVRAVRYIIT